MHLPSTLAEIPIRLTQKRVAESYARGGMRIELRQAGRGPSTAEVWGLVGFSFTSGSLACFHGAGQTWSNEVAGD